MNKKVITITAGALLAVIAIMATLHFAGMFQNYPIITHNGDAITIRTAHAIYNFDDIGWDIDRALKYAKIMDGAIVWTREFTGMDSDIRIEGELLYAQPGVSLGWASRFRINNAGANFGIVAAHEIVHAVMLEEGHRSPLFEIRSPRNPTRSGTFSFFTEGHASALHILFAAEHEAFGQIQEASMRELFEDVEIQALTDVYERLSGRSLDEPLDFVAVIHTVAVAKIAIDPDLFPGWQEINLARQMWRDFPFMYSYQTSASFALYLLDISDHADFLRVYLDPDLFEEVYGKDLEGMLRDWIGFLGLDWEEIR